MQKVLEETIKEMPGNEMETGYQARALQRLAARIATIGIFHYHGQLLYRTLEMARAVAEYDFELENPSG
jgi:hypothetical protein